MAPKTSAKRAPSRNGDSRIAGSGRKKLILAGAAVALAAVAAAWSLAPAKAGASATGAAGASTEGEGLRALGLTFVPHTTYTYALRYASKTKAIPSVGMPGANIQVAGGGAKQMLDGDLDLEGTLAIHAYPSDDAEREGALLGMSLVACKGHFRIGEQPLWPAGECGSIFDHKEFLVRMDRTGRVRGIHAAEGGASLFDYTMRAIVEETQVRLAETPGTQSWVELEPLPQGTVESLYRLLPSSSEADVSIDRIRQRYTALTAASMADTSAIEQSEAAQHRIVIRRDGVIARIEGKEKLAAKTGGEAFLESETALDLAATGQSRDERARPDLSRFTARALEDLPQSRTLHERMLEQRAAGLSWTEALMTLTDYGDAGSLPDHNRFLWRSTALLLLDPKRASDLVEVFENGRPGGKLRGLVLDLLSSVSTPEAQDVMRKLLAGAKAKADPRYIHLVQRMGFVKSPDKESIAFVRRRYAEATTNRNTNERIAAAYVMGSMADNSRKDRDDTTSRELVSELTAALRNAPPSERVHFLRALGNADTSSTFSTFAEHAKSEDPDEREAVAQGLDIPQTPEALGLLLDLAADPDVHVQRAALRSLRRYSLTAPVLVRLVGISEAARFHPDNVRFVLDLVKTYRFVFPREMELLLRSILAHPVDEALVRAAAQQLLDA